MLVRSAVPDRTIDLAGPWRCVKSMNAETTVTVPGQTRGVFLYRDVEIPADAENQEVWLRVEAPCDFAIVNGRLRYWDIGHSPVFPKPAVRWRSTLRPTCDSGRPIASFWPTTRRWRDGSPRSSISSGLNCGCLRRANGRGTASRPARR